MNKRVSIENKLSKFIRGFRKLHGTHHSMVNMLEKWKRAAGKEEYIYILFMHLSKAFETINHDLLLTNLYAYGFSIYTLDPMCVYQKRVQICKKLSSTKCVISRVPQGLIDESILFSLFIRATFTCTHLFT